MRWTFSREATVWGWAPRPALPAGAGVFKDPRENLKVHRILRCTLSLQVSRVTIDARVSLGAKSTMTGSLPRPPRATFMATTC